MPTWKIVIRTDSVESFYTVLKACDKSDGVHIEHAGMADDGHAARPAGNSGHKRDRSKDKKYPVHPGTAGHAFMVHVRGLSATAIGVDEASRWAIANNLSATSGHYLLRCLIANGKLRRADHRRDNKVVYTIIR